ncbi:MAG: hypothetical protein QW775_03685 [Ignisphaera sp.]|uniref:Uncharacterized protein n=1 Tax=Ignisphaera aggregans TaxID=334771 RepID=A0A7C4NNA1_9CREN
MAETDRSILVLVLLITFFTIFLAIVGESRPDAYLSVAILLYFVYTAIDPSIRRYTNLKPLDIGLIIVFAVIVVIRILLVLEVI